MPFQKGVSGNANGRPSGASNKNIAPLKDIMSKWCIDYMNGSFQDDFLEMSKTDQVKVGVDLVKHFVPKAKDESEKDLEKAATSALTRLFHKDSDDE